MAKWKVGSGCDNYIRRLQDLQLNTETTLGRAVYEGAKVITDAVAANIDALPVGTWKANQRQNGPTKAQKQGLKAGLGISRMRNDGGFVNVKIGMDGYNAVKTKKYPKGQPNAMIARTVENGGTWMAKHPFISRAVNSKRATAEAAMAAELDEQIKRKMEG